MIDMSGIEDLKSVLLHVFSILLLQFLCRQLVSLHMIDMSGIEDLAMWVTWPVRLSSNDMFQWLVSHVHVSVLFWL